MTTLDIWRQKTLKDRMAAITHNVMHLHLSAMVAVVNASDWALRQSPGKIDKDMNRLIRGEDFRALWKRVCDSAKHRHNISDIGINERYYQIVTKREK